MLDEPTQDKTVSANISTVTVNVSNYDLEDWLGSEVGIMVYVGKR